MHIRKNSYFWITIVCIIAMTAGCQQVVEPSNMPASPTQSSNLEQIRKKLDTMQNQWQSQGLENYRFQFQWVCFCPAEYREPVWVTVIEEEITSVKAVDSNLETNLPDKKEYYTINELFDFIGEGVEKNAHEVQVTYDDAMGYPVSAYIDYEVDIEDEERGFDILKFETQLRELTETSQPAASNPTITISPTSVSPGNTVQVFATGFPPNIPVNIGIGRVNSEFDVITSTNTNKNGNLDLAFNIPDFVTPQDQYVIVVSAIDQSVKEISSPFDVIQD
jgi:hypothetical protein